MADPIQRSSTVPLPAFQQEAGDRDPLPLDAPKLQQQDAFDAYLEQQSVTTLKKAQAELTFDPASDIQSNSVYQGIGDTKLA